MTTTIFTDHANELILVDDVLDPRGIAVVALGLTNQDGSDTFPGRTLTPDQAEELAASLAQAAAAARATAGLAPTPLGGEQAHAATLKAIRAAVPLASTGTVLGDGQDEQAEATASPPAAPKAVASEAQPPDRARELGELPIADYDQLSAQVITKRLSGLSGAQLSKLLAYEQSHRNRKTICERIAALQSSARTTNPMA
jgi:hypothetical protein